MQLPYCPLRRVIKSCTSSPSPHCKPHLYAGWIFKWKYAQPKNKCHSRHLKKHWKKSSRMMVVDRQWSEKPEPIATDYMQFLPNSHREWLIHYAVENIACYRRPKPRKRMLNHSFLPFIPSRQPMNNTYKMDETFLYCQRAAVFVNYPLPAEFTIVWLPT